MLQHAKFATPDRSHGYCTDDNARALIVAAWQQELHGDDSAGLLVQRYLSFLLHAFNEKTGRFRNFMSYSRQWLEEIGSEDSHGRALMGLGAAVASAPNDSVRRLSAELFRNALPAAETLAAPRAWAFSIVGLHSFLSRFPDDRQANSAMAALAEKLMTRFTKHATDDWPWFEDILTYENARLPHALLLAGTCLKRREMVDLGEKVLRWLLKIQTAESGHLSIIGNDGWYPRGGRPARFDQQPVEAMALIEACSAAYHATQEDSWASEAQRCLDWFLGRNDRRLSMVDPQTGGCSDGLQAQGLNLNQGAESCLAWLISVLTLRQLEFCRSRN